MYLVSWGTETKQSFASAGASFLVMSTIIAIMPRNRIIKQHILKDRPFTDIMHNHVMVLAG